MRFGIVRGKLGVGTDFKFEHKVFELPAITLTGEIYDISYHLNSKLKIQLAANNLGQKYSDPDESTNINRFGIKNWKFHQGSF